MSMRFLNKDRMRKVLKILPEDVRKKIKVAVVEGAEDMANTMRSLAKIHSGHLRDSIKVTPGDEDIALYERVKSTRIDRDPELAAIIHVDAFYSAWVEFGTAPHINRGEFPGTTNPGTHAQPFFFPAYRARKKQVQARINRAAREGIKEGLR